MDGFPFSWPVEVRFSDVDAMNHVNNAVYLAYLELARVRLWQTRFGFAGSARDIPVIVARIAVDYRSPVGLEDPVEVGIGVTHIGRTSFTFRYRVGAGGRLAADAESVQVCFDYGAGRPVPVDEEFRRQLEGLRITPPAPARPGRAARRPGPS